MKKLFNFKTMSIVLLTAFTVNATAATTDGVKTNTTTKTSKKVIDYSKMNYKQLKEAFKKIIEDNALHNSITYAKEQHYKITDENYKRLQIRVGKYIKSILPIYEEVEKRYEKYKDNREAEYMYRDLKGRLKNTISAYETQIKEYESNLKYEKMQKMY